MLELSKLTSMNIRAKEEKCKDIMYVNFFGDNDLIIYGNVAIQKGIAEVRNCKRNTAIDTGYKPKELIMLDKSLGQRFKLIDGNWVKQLSKLSLYE